MLLKFGTKEAMAQLSSATCLVTGRDLQKDNHQIF
jgi:hypothetical protein